jgi:hypothetical protein
MIPVMMGAAIAVYGTVMARPRKMLSKALILRSLCYNRRGL